MDTVYSFATPTGWLFTRHLLHAATKTRTIHNMTAPKHSSASCTLNKLFYTIGYQTTDGNDPVITGISADSRAVKPGNVFIAIRGYTTDGHKYIADAVSRGAIAVVLEDDSYLPQTQGAIAVQVHSSRRAAAVLADEFYNHPSKSLALVGITGTNGKTTTSLMLDSIFQMAGHRTGVIGTLGRFVGDTWRNGERTTPDSIELQRLLGEMRDTGISHVSMEVSSHALDLDRVWTCQFDGTIFTNLSQDHLDWHAGIDEYLSAKLRLFTEFTQFSESGKPMVCAINLDDPSGAAVAAAAQGRVITFGTTSGCQVRARSISSTTEGIAFDLVCDRMSRPVRLNLSGHFNVLNALGAAACCYGMGFGWDEIVAGLEALKAVPGRFERVTEENEYTVIVDYAHSPAALENLLSSARALQPKRILCLMGCGGDRDRGKRPKMGKVAAEMADFTIVTSDNPRKEDPLAIIEDITGGIPTDNYLVIPDRREAIFELIKMAQPGDMVIIAGKGHEGYQEFADHRIDFDDRKVAREAIQAKE